jgi:putative hydrolase of the HAD superfamily
MCFEVIFFDLDETLYPPNAGIWNAIGDRMDQYMVQKLNIPAETVHDVREDLFSTYGTTLRGLRILHHIDEKDFLDYVHDIQVEKYLRPSQPLIDLLSRIKQRKVVFTNADTNHANNVLRSLGIQQCFEQIIDIYSIDPYCKPQPEAMEVALKLANIKNPSDCVLIDDSYRNLVTAHSLGLTTIHVGASSRLDYVDAFISNILDLPDVIPVG